MRKKLLLFLFVFVGIPLFSSEGNFPYIILNGAKWETEIISGYSSQAALSPGSNIQSYHLALRGYYSPITNSYIGGSWKASWYTINFPEKRTLGTIGDLSIEGFYKFFFYRDVSLWLQGGLFLFAPVEDESKYGDTSSYLINVIASYKWHNLEPVFTAGYFYDRRINFSKRIPTFFERIAWDEVDYTWSPLFLGLFYDLGDYVPFVGVRSEILYGEPHVPFFLISGARMKIWKLINLNFSVKWKLYNYKIPGYPQRPRLLFSMGIVVAPLKPVSMKPVAEVKPLSRPSLVVTVDPAGISPTVLLNGNQPDRVKDNQFFFDALLPGKYVLSVTAEDYREYVTRVVLTGTKKVTMHIQLKEEKKPGGILGVAISHGIPVEKAYITISGAVTRTTMSNNQGVFSFLGVPPGSYALKATATDYQGVSKFIEVEPGKKVAIRVEIQPVEYPHGIITLKIKSKDGKSIEKYDFDVKAERFRVLKKKPGELQLYVAPGDVKITIKSAGYKSKKLLFSIDDGDEIETTVKLKQKEERSGKGK